SPLTQLSEHPEARADPFDVGGEDRQCHQALNLERVELTDVPEEAQELFGRHTEFRVLGGGVDLHVDIEAAALSLQPTVEGADDVDPAEGVYLACGPRDSLGLVRLEMADGRPAVAEIGHLLGLPVCLLDLGPPRLVTAGCAGQA